MPIAVMIIGMLLLLPASRIQGRRAFLRIPVIALVSLLQAAFLVYYLVTLEQPPLQ
jgi:hypothetical protein